MRLLSVREDFAGLSIYHPNIGGTVGLKVWAQECLSAALSLCKLLQPGSTITIYIHNDDTYWEHYCQ
jgi:hypothetical protein